MEVRLTSEQEAQLSELAHLQGTEPEVLVRNAALHLLEEESRHRAIVSERIAEADRGIFIEEEEMNERFRKMLRS